MDTSEKIDELATALAKAQAKFPNIGRSETAKAGTYSYTYATLASVLDAVREALAENGLSIFQSPGSEENGKVSMTVMLMHSSGQYLRDTFSMPVGQQTPQGIGSVISYARRYQLLSCLGLATEDDDGEAGMPQKTQHQPQPVSPDPYANKPARKPRTTNEAKPNLQVVESDPLQSAWQALTARAAQFQFVSQDSNDYLYLCDQLCVGSASALEDEDRYRYATDENDLAWETAIEALKAHKQEQTRRAVAK